MLRLILGILLSLAAFALLFLFLRGSDSRSNNVATQIQQTIHCQPGEQFIELLGAYTADSFGRNRGQSVTFYCQDAAGQQRDVTGGAVLVIIGAFVVPFVLGLLLTMWGILGMVRGFTGGLLRRSSVITFNSQPLGAAQLTPQQSQQVEALLRQFGGTATSQTIQQPSNGGAAALSLAEQLEQLQEAYAKGFLTQEEYDRKRQAILDQWQ